MFDKKLLVVFLSVVLACLTAYGELPPPKSDSDIAVAQERKDIELERSILQEKLQIFDKKSQELQEKTLEYENALKDPEANKEGLSLQYENIIRANEELQMLHLQIERQKTTIAKREQTLQMLDTERGRY